MKKHLLLIISLFLLGIALYTVNAYNSTNTKASTNTNTNTNTNTTSISSETENNKGTQATTDSTTDTSNNSDSAPNVLKRDPSTYGIAKDFTLVDLDGNEVSLSDFKGKKVFLNFWATWCPPCKAEMPEIEKVYQETKDSDLVILSVEIGESLETVQSFIEDNNYNFKVLLDLDQSVATTYGISAIPTSFFIDEDGTIVSKRVGGMTYDDMMENIASLEK